MAQKPTVGQIVHYVSFGTPGGEYSSECRAAVITEAGAGDMVGLAVLNPTGMFFNRAIVHDEGRVRPNDPSNLCTTREHGGGTWHWPEHS